MRDPGSGARPDPQRTDARVAVHVLSWSGADHGSRLSSTPRSGVNVQLCGDAHLSNFGVFGSPERQLMFDINDFDETLPGPWEWDVKRLAASCEILGRDRGFAASDRRAIVRAGVAEYRNVMRRAANMGTLDVWYDHLDIGEVLDWVHTEAAEGRIGKREAREAEEDVAKARTRDSTRVFAKRADEVDGKLRIVSDPPLIVPFDDLTDPGTTPDDVEKQIRSSVQRYRRSLSDHHHPSRSSTTSTVHARSSASAASAPAPGSIFSWAETIRTRCSCSRRKQRRRCWSDSSARVSTPITAVVSWLVNG